MSNKDLIYEKITALFADDSMPPMILLDGKWGCGKSYYVTQTLMPKLEKVNGDGKRQKVLYFSVYGISGLDDFRDKLISAYYLKDENTSGFLTPLANLTMDLGKHFDAEKGGLVATVLSGFKGIAKHSLLSKLSDFILILDDLERVSDADLCEQILAECLEFSASVERNIKVIAVGNSEHIPSLESFLNKVFMDQLVFNFELEQLFAISFGFLELELHIKENILRVIRERSLTNLRVLKRSAYKISKIIPVIKGIDEIDYCQAIGALSRQIIILCHVHYEQGNDYKFISKALTNISFHNLLDDAVGKHGSEKTPEEKALDALASISSVSDDMVRFSCGEIYFPEDIKDYGYLPKIAKPMNQLIFSKVGSMTEGYFKSAYNQLLDYIQKTENVECKKWFLCIDTLDYLLRNSYTTSPDFLTRGAVDYAEMYWQKVEFIDDVETDVSYRGMFQNKEVESLLRKAIIGRLDDKQNTEREDFKDKMLKSWANVDMLFYEKMDHRPVFNQLTQVFLKSCLDNWGHIDIHLFLSCLKERYGFENIADYYSEESESLIAFSKLIRELIPQYAPSLKAGALVELLVVVESIANKLKSPN